MTDASRQRTPLATPRLQHGSARSLRSLVTPYAQPGRRKALWQLANALPPLVGLWVFMALTLESSRGWSLLLALPAAGLYVRLFIIQHDCGHGSFFASARMNRTVGAVLGLMTLFRSLTGARRTRSTTAPRETSTVAVSGISRH